MAREAFSDQQWQELVEAAPAIARAVSAASGSPARTEPELEAFLRLLEQTRIDTDDQGLLGALTADIHSRLSTGTLNLAADDVVADGVHAAREAGALLAVVPDEHEARAVRYWLMEVARTVASARREGGILGVGGQEISRSEQDTLAAISDALGMSGGADMAREASEEEAPHPEAGGQPTTDEQPSGQPTSGQAGEQPTGADAAQAEPQVGPDGQPVGEDNIREGTVRGLMGGPHRQEGQGQGG